MAYLGRNVWEEVLFVAYSFFVLAVLAGLGRLLVEWQPDARLWFRAARAELLPVEVDGEVFKIARARFLKQKALHFRRFFRLLALVWSTAAVYNMGLIFLQMDRQTTKVQDGCLLAMLALSVLTIVRPSVVTPQTLDILSVLVMLWPISLVVPSAVHEDNVLGSVVLATALPNVMCFVRVSSSRSGFVLFSACNVLLIFYTKQTLEKFELLGLCVLRERFVFMQVVLLVACTGCAHLVELGAQSTVVQTVQFQMATEQKAAAWALLRSICDVVVELDEEGLVLSSAEDFASFLLRGTAASLRGARLADLLADDGDREQFARRLRAPAQKDVGLAENIPVSLRDGDGNLVSVEVLLFPFRHFDIQHHYIAGIREYSDRPFRPASKPGAPSGGANLSPRASRRNSRGNIATILGNEHFAVPETASISSGSEDPAAALAFVDYLRPGLPVRRLSSGFVVRIGRLAPNSTLSGALADPQAFLAWLDLAMTSTRPVPDVSVTLLMPQGPMRAMCRVVEVSETAESISDPGLTCLSFSAIAPDQRPSQRQSSLKGTPRTPSARVLSM